MTTEITVKGAREHNLRDVNLTLPRGQLICFSGVSGSGKSSLAFDTLYAEGQRRYVESLSNYARQFMGQMPKPDVDFVGGLSPSISISQKSTGNNPRSTVGTITEIYDFLRVVFARVGTGYCPTCDIPITAQTRDSILVRILALDPESTLWIMAPLIRGQKGEFRDLFEDLRRQGFSRARVNGETILLSDPPALDRQHRHHVEVIVERLDPESRDRGRVTDAIDIALRLGEGSLIVSESEIDSDATGPVPQDTLFSSKYACGSCGRSFQPPSPQLFSFNSPQGMCTGCDGLGQLYTFVPDLLIPDSSLSFKAGAIALLGKWADMGRYRRHIYQNVATAIDSQLELAAGSMLTKPWSELPELARHIWLWGVDEALSFTWRGGKSAKKYEGEFNGIIPELLDRYRGTKNKLQLRQFEKYMQTMECVDCGGFRLNPQATSVKMRSGGKAFASSPEQSLPKLCGLSIAQLLDFFSDIQLGATDTMIASEAIKEIRARLGFLRGVGLEYLTLARTAPTLSGGESQRIRLAGQIGSGLVGVLYILDEPSIGLHPHDNERLIETLLKLRDTGNTLIVVEHDEDTMRASDLIVDFGPGPGIKGGRVVALGDIDAITNSPKSVTGQFLSGKRSIQVPSKLRSARDGNWLTIRGAKHNNLKDIDVSIPLGTLCCVTGMSGSGKSSFVGDILEPLLRSRLNGAECEIGTFDSIEGLEFLDKTIAIDQSPIGRTPRSNPATYVKVFDEIRELFAKMNDAKTRGYTASRFSFNVDGGRCSACEGNGANKLEMDFLADVWVTCPVCAGKRYNRETLAVKFKDHSIADVLDLDISQALKLFKNIPKIAETLQTLVDVGLEYLKLGQPSPTLSGGEAQRIKLSRELSKRATGRTLYVLDEPTTGLHFADIELLLKVLHGLADRGNTLVVVEHNLDVIKTSDWVIDLGPDGGDGGGRIVAQGTPAEIAKVKDSYTGIALAKVLNKSHAKKPTKVLPINSERTASRTHITVEAAEQHNLKSVNASIPRDAMTVFCGPSGSGKSSLAMHTIYAEGQRRYVESLSAYARQFIGSVQKPKAEKIEGLSPAIALEQKNLGHSPRSTVGTVTEVYDYFRILMARLGTMHCPRCQTPVGTQTSDQIVSKVLAMPAGSKVLLLAPIEFEASDDPTDRWKNLRAGGYQRVRIDGKTYPIDGVPMWDPRIKHRVQIVVDRSVINEEERSRINDSVEQALSLSGGVLDVAIADEEREEPHWTEIRHSQHLVCGTCSRSFQALTPHHFSFNSAVGWCPQCDGLGTQTGTNPAALLTSPSATLAEGASLLWPSVDHAVSRWMLRALSRQTGVPLNVPIEEMTVSQRRTLYHGCGDQWIDVQKRDAQDKDADNKTTETLFRFQFKGFYPALDDAAKLTPSLRGRLEMFTDEVACSSCDGARIRDDAAAVRFRQMTIGDLVQLPLGKVHEIIRDWKLDTRERKIAGELVREIESRIRFLLDVGLEYLTLSRGAATLSGGESQRIRLAAQLGSGLCGVLYVLDEPTIGLHPRDNDRLIGAMHRLRDLGNTLLVVEHDRDVIASSDYLCDFGPLAGRGGGRIVAEGPPTKIEPRDQSVTAGFIDNSQQIAIPFPRRPIVEESTNKKSVISDATKFITIVGARENNLRAIDVRFPLGVFTAITGPSGSGKSSLVNGILYPALARKLHRAKVRPGRHTKIDGTRFVDKIIRVDQSPLGNTPSSNPATYTGLFDHIRALFSRIPEAGERGFTPRTFSFNVSGGRCDACEGTGKRRIEMHFLPDVWVECETCLGKRYNSEVLEVKYHGYSISDVLDLPIGEAVSLFADHPKIVHILQTICDVGLDYVTLGQSAPTLSGGEAQRIKLSAELARPDTGRTLYLLDEPTTGLHFKDIERLLNVIQRLVELGNTVIVIEHNLDVIKCSDWVIDVGPEAGSRGGTIVIEGTPEDVASYAIAAKKNADAKKPSPDPMPRSHTGEYLAKVLELSQGFESVESVTKPVVVPVNGSAKQPVVTPEPVNESVVTWDEVQPWKVLGRKWHSVSKGFPNNQTPQWPLELADQALSLLEAIAGDDTLQFVSPDRVAVRDIRSQDTWAEVETKATESLRVTLAGPVDAIDLGILQKLGIDGPVDLADLERTRVTLNLTDLKHVRSRNLKAFLKKHWERSAATS
jgi:excinuclease ABC subunit A